MSTEDNNGDIVRAMRKQMDEMNKNNHELMAEMNAMCKASRDLMKGGMTPFGVDRRVDLPAVPLLPSCEGFASPQVPKTDVDVETKQPPGSGNPNARKKVRDEGEEER